MPWRPSSPLFRRPSPLLSSHTTPPTVFEPLPLPEPEPLVLANSALFRVDVEVVDFGVVSDVRRALVLSMRTV
jgi:hypothetical protein